MIRSKTRTRVVSSAIAAGLAAFIFSTAAAEEPQRISVPLSEPGRPVTLRASLLNGSLSVEGHDGDQVLIEIVSRHAGASEERVQGMRRIPNTSAGLSVEEQGNVVEVHGNWGSKVSVLHIQVPRRTSMRLKTINNGDIRVRGVEGELELDNTNGSIEASGVSGSVVAHTTNGEVKVSFERIDTDTAMSFVTFHGDVDVTFPRALDADLRISTVQGDIFTDFEFKVAPSQPTFKTDRDGERYRVIMKDEVLATVGSGGPEMHFKSWSGNVYIRATER